MGRFSLYFFVELKNKSKNKKVENCNFPLKKKMYLCRQLFVLFVTDWISLNCSEWKAGIAVYHPNF